MILETEKLSQWYRQVIALNDVSLSAPEGIVGLLGPNGSGKTTLMRLAVGLMKPSAGTIKVNGEVPWNNPDLFRRIGYAPEHDGLFEFQTGFDFVRTLLRLRGFSSAEAEERTHRAVERVGLEKESLRKIFTYSRGMRQRIKLAQAISHEPELLILDESLSGADPSVRRRLVSLIRSFPKEGKHVLVSSHILHEVEKLTDRVILFHRGRLIADGKVAEIRDLIDRHPHSVRVRTTKTRELAAALPSWNDVTEILFPEDDVLLVRTREPDAFYRRLPGLALETGCEVTSISSPDDNLEAVFRYLTER